MPRRKKYPKLPNGYGSIKYLGKGRRNPYAVHPPTQEFALSGSPITPKALCYTDAWIKGFTVLTAYKAGTYYPGMELELNLEDDSTDNLEALAQKLLADYNATRPVEQARKENEKTFKDIYNEFFKWKFESGKSYSSNTITSMNCAFKRCAPLHNKVFSELKYDDLQTLIDSSKLSHAAVEHDVNLLKQLYRFALINEYVEKDPAQYLKINKEEDDTPGEPFSDEELKAIWKVKTDPTAEFVLIMCYSGFRISAYKTLEVNLEELYFRGGIKTKAGMNRIVPIHSAILPLVTERLKRDGELFKISKKDFRTKMYLLFEQIGIKKHTPHDCRHTFSRLCEKYKVNENDRKRMMGHSFGTDITNGVYGHRTCDELRNEIEKIKTE